MVGRRQQSVLLLSVVVAVGTDEVAVRKIDRMHRQQLVLVESDIGARKLCEVVAVVRRRGVELQNMIAVVVVVVVVEFLLDYEFFVVDSDDFDDIGFLVVVDVVCDDLAT